MIAQWLHSVGFFYTAAIHCLKLENYFYNLLIKK